MSKSFSRVPMLALLVFIVSAACGEAQFAQETDHGSGDAQADQATDHTSGDAPADQEPDHTSVQARSAKKGLVVGSDVLNGHLDLLQAGASWFYNYTPSPTGQNSAHLAWLNANPAVEFVPMVWGDTLVRTSGTKCTFDSTNTSLPLCTVQDLIDVLHATKSALTTAPVYLMGFNEPWSSHQHPPSGISASVAADMWRKFIQPAAAAASPELKLVSPTTRMNIKLGELTWFSDFLKACYDYKSDASFPCDVEKIQAISIHAYKCDQSFWETNYGPSGAFRASLKTNLGTYGGKTDWGTWVDNRPLWVTETDCASDAPNPPSSYHETCLRMTGQAASSDGFGNGSIRTLESLSSVQRYAWWITYYVSKDYSLEGYSNLTDSTPALTPAGSGYLDPLATCP